MNTLIQEFVVYFDYVLKSELKWVILALTLGMVVVMVSIGILTYKRIQFKEAFHIIRDGVSSSFNKLEKRSKARLVQRLQLVSGDSIYKVKLSFFETMDLKLVERSNIRSFIPFLNVYVLIILSAIIFVILFLPVLEIFKTVKTSLVITAFLSLIPSIILETMSFFYSSKTRKIIGDFLDTLLGWLVVKRDLVFALENSIDDVELPLRNYLIDAVAQLKSGVDTDHVFDILSYKVNTEQFYTISKNFKSCYNNGGDIVGLVRVLAQEAHQIQSEFETRIVDTFMTRAVLNVFLISVSVIIFGMLFGSETMYTLYTTTEGGQNALFYAVFFYVIGFVANFMTSKSDY